ncbi:MAG: STAS domain-containing protein [Byssovorax sp.]
MSDDQQDAHDALEVINRVGDALIVLSDVACGDFHTRCPANLPESNPLGALFSGINEMIDTLESESRQSRLYQQQLEEKLATIEEQRSAIRELSAPIIEVRRGVLCLVIVGALDGERSAETTETLLQAVCERRARGAIIDITGLQLMDASTADHFVRMAQAVRLLGAECMLTGVNPLVARTLVGLGVDMVGITVHRTLDEALQDFNRRDIRR